MVLSLPAGPSYQSGKWRLVSNAARFSSPISRKTQTVARVGNFWAAQIAIPPIRDTGLASRWASFCAKLCDGESFYLYPPILQQSVIGGSPQIDGASQLGQTLALKNFSPGDTIKEGSFFCYDTSTFRMLHIATADTVAGSDGKMSLPIRPAIRKSPPNNAAINLSYPSCEMISESPDLDLLTLTDAVWYGQSLSVIEDVRP
jgi:hypothetical protein